MDFGYCQFGKKFLGNFKKNRKLYHHLDLASFFSDRFLSVQDEQFVQYIHTDLKNFISRQYKKSVLIFPPFNSFHRFLVHKCTEDYSDLKSFSIGQKSDRRLVVCYRSDFIGESADLDNCMSNPRPSIGRGRARGRIRQDGSSPGVSPVGSRATTVPVHDGPGGLNTNVNEGTELRRNQKTKDRRPEVQRYVPRGRRDQDVPVNQAGQNSQTEDHKNIENIPDTSKDRQHGSECTDEKTSQRKSKKSRIAQVYIPPSKRREIEQTRKNSHGDDESVSRSGENDNDVPENWDEDDAITSTSSFQDESGGQEQDACKNCENKQGSELEHDDNVIKHSIQSDIEGSKPNHDCSTGNDNMGPDKELETKAAIQSSNVQYKRSDNDNKMNEDKVKKIRSKNGENIVKENRTNENDKDASSAAKEDMTMYSVSQNDEIAIGEQTSSIEMVELENKENSIAQNDTMEQIENSCYNLDQKERKKEAMLENVSTSKTEDSCIIGNHNSVNDTTNETEMMECSIPPCISDENKDGEKYVRNSDPSSKGQQLMAVEDQCSKNDKRLKSEDITIDSEQVAEVRNSAKSNSVFENLNEQDSTKASPALDFYSTEQSQGNVEKSLVKYPDGKVQKSFSKDKKEEQTNSQSSEPNNDLKSSKESVKSQKSGKKKKLKDKIQERERDTVTGDMDIISIVSSDKMRGDESTKTEMESSGDKTKKKKKNVVKIKKKTKKQEADMEVIEQENEGEEENVPESWTERNKIGSDNEEDSWDTMFDDDGECVDPSTMEELTANVGKVQIKKPVINYLNYQPKEPELDYEGMNHVIEIFDFSPDLKTEDLLSAFNQFKSKGFDIKWVDDTHALGVFSSEIAAKEALQFTHPLLKVQPLSLACKQSKIKAKKAVEFLQPYKPRPETTAVVARRMLTGALGLKTNVSKEQRDKEREEKQKLKQAKEKKKKDRQLKEDIWEGNVTPSVQSDE